MKHNEVKSHHLSPWLQQIRKERVSKKVDKTIRTDIAIIGGGIAGVTTAYYLLKHTKKKVILIEGSKIAHGATGHNAGQVVAYFEKPFSEIVEEYGLHLAAKAQKDVLNAWNLLKDIYRDTKIKVPLTIFKGYAGCSSVEQVLVHLHNKELRHKANIRMEKIYVADDKSVLEHVSRKYSKLYTTRSQKDILSMLQTRHKHYVAALETKKGTLNSALFCEELIHYFQHKYPKRFTLYEHSPVSKVILHKKYADLKSHKNIRAGKVILCTNGFEHIHVINKAGAATDKKFHESVIGIVSHMAGYIEENHKLPIAISYFDDKEVDSSAAYFYLTRRKYEFEGNKHCDLVCVGGPEITLRDKSKYVREKDYHPTAHKQIKKFVKSAYTAAPKNPKYSFFWHGLMGYTKTKLRIVGFEPCNSVLLYNLGCNGVGILPSIYGAKRIADLLTKKKAESTIFDPKDVRCELKKSKSDAHIRPAKIHRI
ncbi:hypothetical protein COV18_03160 [Candidatus Woesearchaeota archaeon CG10_big_fil_rev_8_21_14_0_10_37_12]|nr:MAG: hypothetical protein COV18_03160 [Candidatus Woesearchaeota archaeon CG10_big_fil_rev_8_21_14_0_10_37_12]